MGDGGRVAREGRTAKEEAGDACAEGEEVDEEGW
jgi:hypothetical protein